MPVKHWIVQRGSGRFHVRETGTVRRRSVRIRSEERIVVVRIVQGGMNQRVRLGVMHHRTGHSAHRTSHG